MFGGSVAHPFSGHATPDRNTQLVLRVEVAHALRPEAGEAWRDLVRRAVRPNVFMEPGFVHATAHTRDLGAATNRYILVWDSAEGPSRLLGAWAFVLGRASAGLPVRVLSSHVDRNLAFLADPVIDANHVQAVLTSMLDTISADDSLPKLVSLT